MSRAESLVEAFYEDAALRDSLTDDEADVLLKWATEQAARLDAAGLDDAAFEDQSGRLRSLLKRLNRTAGESAYASPEARAAELSAIAEAAQAVGLSFTPPFSAQAAPASPAEALNGLLAALAPASPQVAPPVPPAAPHEPPEKPAPDWLPAPNDEEFYDL